jgi:hypothetical protein
MPTNNTDQPKSTTTEVAELRQQWDHLRKQSRQMAADAQNLRRQSRELVKQWKLTVAKTRQLHNATELSLQGQSSPIPNIAQQKPFVATARRVPWRRLQMEDLDGPYQLWSSPNA